MPARASRSVAVAVATLLLALAAGPAVTQSVAADPEEAAWMFDPGAVAEIDLGGLSQVEMDALEADPDDYQRGTFELSLNGIAQGPPLGEVGIRLKGGLGSFRPLSAKAAFKVKFDKSSKTRLSSGSSG